MMLLKTALLLSVAAIAGASAAAEREPRLSKSKSSKASFAPGDTVEIASAVEIASVAAEREPDLSRTKSKRLPSRDVPKHYCKYCGDQCATSGECILKTQIMTGCCDPAPADQKISLRGAVPVIDFKLDVVAAESGPPPPPGAGPVVPADQKISLLGAVDVAAAGDKVCVDGDCGGLANLGKCVSTNHGDPNYKTVEVCGAYKVVLYTKWNCGAYGSPSSWVVTGGASCKTENLPAWHGWKSYKVSKV